ncbi:uncharacterized protein TNCV_699651 [Trichonephila clavipes]|nr:uncharacterized protein TNCV_699651 [Trichonephila clavipes]
MASEKNGELFSHERVAKKFRFRFFLLSSGGFRNLHLHFNAEAWMSRSDEAHFWLNGYDNKQNCRIWSEANPQVYVGTPLHPEKLTVWCALWAGGILLQKR